ncbi:MULTISPECIES: PoNe immunity protein domain-containing protein [Cupriavidus]
MTKMQALPPIDWTRWAAWHIPASRFEQRREPYLLHATYERRTNHKLSGMAMVTADLPKYAAKAKPGDLMISTRRRLWDVLDWLSLQYSAGAPAELFGEVWPYALVWAEEYAGFHEAYHRSPEADGFVTPHAALRTEDYWIVALRLVCFGLLTNNAAEMPRVMTFLDYGNEAMGVRDGLLERLVAPFVLGRGAPPDKATRHLPYRKLFKVFDAQPAKRPALMAQYLDEWYHASRRELYTDQHADGVRTDLNFFGYWSWEAAAVTWLLDIDDTSYRHMPFYPRDLVDFARQASGSILPSSPPPPQYADSPCTQAGFWSTSAKRGSRRYFAEGEIFPAIPSDTTFGLTLWAWDDDQRSAE